MYHVEVLPYAPAAKRMGKAVEEKANAMKEKGYSLVSFSVTPSCRAILVFEKKED